MLALPARRVALAGCALGFALSFAAFYPGRLAPDESWFGLTLYRSGALAVFAAHLALFWTGLFLVGKAMIEGGSAWGVLTPLLGLPPMLFDFFGPVNSESALACSWLFACAFAFERAVAGRHALAGGLASLIALGYGALMRIAALPAALPVLYLFTGEAAPQPRYARWIVTALVPLLLIAAAIGLDRDAFGGARHRALIAFDLGSMSALIGENLLPGRWTRADETQILQCGVNQWRGDGRCAFVSGAMPEDNLWGAWLGGIAAHPGAYARHRLDYANRLLRWLGEAPEIVTDTAANVSTLRADGNFAAAAIAPMAHALGATPLFRGYAWLLAALAVTWLGLLAADSTARRFAVALGASALIYIAVQISCGVDDSFQRLFWPVAASLAGGFALLACRWPAHSRLGALVLIGCVCVAAFAASALIV